MSARDRIWSNGAFTFLKGRIVGSGQAKDAEQAKKALYEKWSEPAMRVEDPTEPFPMLIHDEIVYVQIEWIQAPKPLKVPEGMQMATVTMAMGQYQFRVVESPEPSESA